jgi:FkbH-like protein
MLESVHSSIARAEWQSVVFSEKPRRAGLLELAAADLPTTPLRIHVHRNQPFEFVASCAEAFLRYAGWNPVFTFGPYDDSLSFTRRVDADIELVWLDLARYPERPSELRGWLGDRIRHLRGLSDAPILAASADPTLIPSLPGVRACMQASMEISATACVENARQLAFLWLPPLVRPRFKAVVVDLDHTLYRGVLGEDGPLGIQLTPEHSKLQKTLTALQASGILLGVVSKNDAADVEAMFEQRSDFPLTRPVISAWSVGWGAKSQGIHEIAARLRIGSDSILYLDDNAGELAEIASAAPEVSLLHAADPVETARALRLYPGLNGYETGAADRLRAFDLAVAPRRTSSSQEYMQWLRIELGFSMDPAQECARLHDLSVRTNQFNTGFLRLTEAEVARRIADPEYPTVAVSLRDRLSDSGIIGAIFARRTAETILVEEICISCRALGRGIEDALIAEALAGIVRQAGGAKDLVFRLVEGPRNAPARDWMERYTAGQCRIAASTLWNQPLSQPTPELRSAACWA